MVSTSLTITTLSIKHITCAVIPNVLAGVFVVLQAQQQQVTIGIPTDGGFQKVWPARTCCQVCKLVCLPDMVAVYILNLTRSYFVVQVSIMHDEYTLGGQKSYRVHSTFANLAKNNKQKCNFTSFSDVYNKQLTQLSCKTLPACQSCKNSCCRPCALFRS